MTQSEKVKVTSSSLALTSRTGLLGFRRFFAGKDMPVTRSRKQEDDFGKLLGLTLALWAASSSCGAASATAPRHA